MVEGIILNERPASGSPFDGSYLFAPPVRPVHSPVTGREYHDAAITQVQYSGEQYALVVEPHGAFALPLEAFDQLLPSHLNIATVTAGVHIMHHSPDGRFDRRKTAEESGAELSQALGRHLEHRRVLAVVKDGGLEDIALVIEPKITGGCCSGHGMRKFL